MIPIDDARFQELVRPFARGLLDKIAALQTVSMNKHQMARLRESVGVDIRKVADIVVPDVVPAMRSVAAIELAQPLGVDLSIQTWQSQKKFDPGHAVFHYEHLNTVKQIVTVLKDARTPLDVVDLLRASVRIAWITKDEDRRLTALGFRSNRRSALDAYAAANIDLVWPEGMPDP